MGFFLQVMTPLNFQLMTSVSGRPELVLTRIPGVSKVRIAQTVEHPSCDHLQWTELFRTLLITIPGFKQQTDVCRVPA